MKVLYIGQRKGYGSIRYSTNEIRFDPSLANLKSLEYLWMMNNFGDDIPEFIYSLPNLKKLILNAIYLSSDFSKLDFGKLACKESLQELWIDYLGDFSNINQNIKLFPNLNEIRISTRGSKVPPTGFINLPNVYFLKIIGYVKDNNRYHATTIFTFDNSVKEKPLDEIERKEAMEKWNEFMSKIEED